jgi:hypothetical protein
VAEISLESLLEVQRADYDASFSNIEHEIACDDPPSATIQSQIFASFQLDRAFALIEGPPSLW